MTSSTYATRRAQLETYFDRTAVEAWARLTSDAPVSRIRATVRAGRDAMRAELLSWLPADLSGRRLLDAGCGTGALALEAARRGADGRGDRRVADAGRPRPRAHREPPARGPPRFPGRRHAGRGIGALRPRRGDGFADPLPHPRHRPRPLGARPPHRCLGGVHGRPAHPAADRDARGRPPLPPATGRRRSSRSARGLAPPHRRRSGPSGFTVARSRRINSGFYLSNALELARR